MIFWFEIPNKGMEISIEVLDIMIPVPPDVYQALLKLSAQGILVLVSMVTYRCR